MAGINQLSTGNPLPLHRYFVGFSTQTSAQTGIRTFYDIELINIDLMTAFQTRVGERVMRPDWGCHLWDYLMEPWTNHLNDKIIQESVRIVSLDTRLVLINVQAFQLANGFRVELTLQYKPWLVIATFKATFENNDLIYFDSSPSSNPLIG